MDRKKTVVLFGGQSSEHIVSCMSAVNVIRQIDRERYELLLIGITEDGRWIRTDCVEDIESGAWRKGTVKAVILPDAVRRCVLLQDGERQWEEKVDVVMFGHTHVPYIDIGPDLTILNPGSLSFPRQEGRKGSYMILEMDEDGGLEFSQKYLE